jgi:hypothetical protein
MRMKVQWTSLLRMIVREPRRWVVLDPDGADLFWKNVRTKRTKRIKYPLTQARLGGKCAP